MKTWKQTLTYNLILITLIAVNAHAVDVKNPITLCERFISEEQQKDCAQKVEKIAPDWYLASTCDLVFDHDQFFACLETPVAKNWDPNGLQSCQAENQADKDRLNCIQMAAKTKSNIEETTSNQRMPASAETTANKPDPKKTIPTVLPKKRFD